MSNEYEVLNPWAEVDPAPLRGISRRLPEIDGKKIGLLVNGKIAARPAQDAVERRLKERFPSVQTSRFLHISNDAVAEARDRAAYEEWLKTVDAVILAVGD